MKVLIVDDEQSARMALRGVLESHFPEVEIMDEARDLPEAVRKLNHAQPDLVFLDIEMPGYSGLELVNFFEPGEIRFKIVFVTAYSEYAVQAFEISAIDYLLKPVRRDQLERALSKLQPTTTQQIDSLRINLSDQAGKRIGLQLGDGLLFVELNDIMYLKADGSYTHIQLQNGEKYTVTKKLLEYEKLEHWGDFMRIHRSHMVNLNHIRRLLRQDGGQLIMRDGEQFGISPDRKAELLERLQSFKI